MIFDNVFYIRDNLSLDTYLAQRKDKTLAQVGNLIGVVDNVYARPDSDTFELITCGEKGIARVEFEAFENRIELNKIMTTKKGTDAWNQYKSKLPSCIVN